MARKKKEINKPKSIVAGSFAARLREHLPDSATAADLTRGYKYIDFCDPTKKNRPTISMEWLFGSRGLLRGRVMNMIAKGSCGKTSLMYYFYACAQLMESGAWCAHGETEGAPHPSDFISAYGVDTDDLIIHDPRSFDELTAWIDTVEATVRGSWGGSVNPETGKTLKSKFDNPLDPECNAPIVLGVDSISVLGKESETMVDIADTTTDRRIAGLAKPIRDYLGIRVKRFSTRDLTLMLASQETQAINTNRFAPKGSDTTCKAYEALYILSTYVLLMSNKKWTDSKPPYTQYGDIITLRTTKNKVATRNRELQLYLRFNHGFDMVETDINWLRTHPASPFKDDKLKDKYGEITVYGGRYTCKLLQDKAFESGDALLEGLYGNSDVINSIREDLRIRGYGFDFETKYTRESGDDHDSEDVFTDDSTGAEVSE